MKQIQKSLRLFVIVAAMCAPCAASEPLPPHCYGPDGVIIPSAYCTRPLAGNGGVIIPSLEEPQVGESSDWMTEAALIIGNSIAAIF